jgi:hypothetical protein
MDVMRTLVPLSNPHTPQKNLLDQFTHDPMHIHTKNPGSDTDPLLDRATTGSDNTTQSSDNNDALNQFLNPQSGVQPVGILTIADLWGVVAVAGGAGLAIAVSELFETAKFFGVIPMWQRILWTMLITFISILLATILVRTTRRVIRIVRVEYERWVTPNNSDEK